MKRKSLRVADVVILVWSLVFFLGMFTFLKPCDAMEDGSFMTCHWSGQAILGVSAVLAVLSVLLLVIRSLSVKRGIAIAIIPVGLLAAAIPGRLIHQCMMDTMRCNMIMKPGVTILGIAVAALAVIDAVLLGKEEKLQCQKSFHTPSSRKIGGK